MGDEFPIREVTAIARRAARQVFNGDHITQQDLIQEGVIASWRAWDAGKRGWGLHRKIIRDRITTCVTFGTRLGSENPRRRSVHAYLTDDDSHLDVRAHHDRHPSLEAVDWLPPLPERDVIFLRAALDGQSASAAARQLGLSEGYGRSEWKRIRLILQDAYERTTSA